MKKLSYLGLLLLTVIFLDSCSIVKRRYSPGYTVVWNAKSKVKKSNGQNEMSNNRESISKNEIKSIKNNDEVVSSINSKNSEMESGSAYAIYNSTTENVLASADVNNSITPANITKENKFQNFVIQSTFSSQSTSPSSINKGEIGKNSHKHIMKAKNKILKSSASSPEPWVYALLILLVPFGTTISMYLYEGSWTKRVTVNLILTLLCGIPGLIHALIVIFGKK